MQTPRQVESNTIHVSAEKLTRMKDSIKVTDDTVLNRKTPLFFNWTTNFWRCDSMRRWHITWSYYRRVETSGLIRFHSDESSWTWDRDQSWSPSTWSSSSLVHLHTSRLCVYQAFEYSYNVFVLRHSWFSTMSPHHSFKCTSVCMCAKACRWTSWYAHLSVPSLEYHMMLDN